MLLPKALSCGLTARAVVASAVRKLQQQPAEGGTRLQAGLRSLCSDSHSSQHAARSFGSSAASGNLKTSEAADADKGYFEKLGLPEEIAELLARKGTYDNFPLDAEAVTAVESLPAQHREDFAAVLKPVENAVLQKAGELQRRRRSEGGDAAGDAAAEDVAKDANAGNAAGRTGGEADGKATKAKDDDAAKDVPSVAALMALGLPEDIAEILANEDIEYPLLAERIVAIENALLLAAADKLRAERGADMAHDDAASARQDVAAGSQERERQAGLIDRLKGELRTIKQQLKDALGHIANRGILDREEDRMRYGAGNEQQGRDAAQAERVQRWTAWVEEHPDDAAALVERTGWRPQDIPREMAALYEALRDYSGLDELLKGDPDRPEVDMAAVKRALGDEDGDMTLGGTAAAGGTGNDGDGDAAAADAPAAKRHGSSH